MSRTPTQNSFPELPLSNLVFGEHPDDGDQDVVDQQHLINEFALLRNKFIGLTKALDAKQFQINNIVKLRAAGLEDVSL